MSRGLPGTTVPVSHEPLFRLMVLATLSCSQPRGQADGRARSQSLPALTCLPEHPSPGPAALPASAAACARSALNARTALNRIFGECAKNSHITRTRDHEPLDRQSAVSGTRVTINVDLGGRQIQQ